MPTSMLARVGVVANLFAIGAAIVFGVGAQSTTSTAPTTPTSQPGSIPSDGKPLSVTIAIDASKTVGPMQPMWRYFGADEPNYAYMKDGKKLLTEIGELGKAAGQPAYFRAHSLLVTGDGTPALKWGSTNAYTEDAQGNPVYDWTIVDRIFDTYIERGMKPYVQVGFMPEAMSTKPQPYQHHWTPTAKYDEIYTGWAYPPKDYNKWAELVYQWTKHCVEKYGKAECETWWWELWNEPNITYWRGTHDEFFKLYDYTADAVRRALPTARVGGPETAGGTGRNFMRDFFEHALRGKNAVTGQTGTPVDFISFHAKGQPKFVDGHVRMGISNQLTDIDGAFKLIASYPEMKNKPIVIGESDPDGCAACRGPQLGYRNGTMYSSYTAASFARKYELADKYGVNLEGALTWGFEFEDQPFFAGFRVMATNGIDLPVFNVFRMFSKMSGQRVSVTSSADAGIETIRAKGVRGDAEIDAIAAIDKNQIAVMVWHYHDDDLPGPDAQVQISITPFLHDQMPTVTQYRIDETHSNAFTAWKQMGSPAKPTEDQYKKLESAGQLEMAGKPGEIFSGNLSFLLPRQAVSLFIIRF